LKEPVDGDRIEFQTVGAANLKSLQLVVLEEEEAHVKD